MDKWIGWMNDGRDGGWDWMAGGMDEYLSGRIKKG